MPKKSIFLLNASLILVLLAACNVLKPTPTPLQPTQAPPATTGVQYHFVTNKLMLPTTKAQTQAFALNVDGDAQQRPDNLLGTLLTLLVSAAPNLELQSKLDQAINAGQLVSLHLVKADDLQNDPSVSWFVFLGQSAPSTPRFDGSDQFALNPVTPTNAPIVGTLKNGRFTGGPGIARLQLYLLGQPVEVDLVGMRLEADISQLGCANGKLGGGVTGEEFRGKLLPTLATGLNQIIKADQTLGNTLLAAFDSDHDGTLTVAELENDPLLMLAISPDLDLMDAAGKFNPGQDGVKDSYSVGLGFLCVPATFTAPGD